MLQGAEVGGAQVHGLEVGRGYQGRWRHTGGT